MTKQPRLFFFITLIALSVLLSACSGAAAESWPGITALPDQNAVYVAYVNQIYKVNLDNGAEAGRFPVEADGKISFYAPPAVLEDGSLLAGAYNFAFYKFNAGAAQPAWTFAEAKDRFIAAPLVMSDLALAPSADGKLYALRLQDGGKAWEFKAGHSLWSKPATDGETIYVSSTDHHVYALNPQTGAQVWASEDLGGQIVTSPTLSPEGVLYVATFGSKTDDPARTSQLIALEAASGRKVWNLPVTGWVWSSPLLVEDTLYFGDTHGYFYAVDAQAGTVRWKYPASGTPNAKTSILGAPAVIDDKVYFGSEAGVLTILNRLDGTTPLEKTIGGQIYSDLVVAGDVILLAPINFESAILVAVHPDGNVKWQFLPARQ